MEVCETESKMATLGDDTVKEPQVESMERETAEETQGSSEPSESATADADSATTFIAAVEPDVEKIETADEKLERIRAFYDTELSRPELESKGPPIKWTLLTYQAYYQQQWYGGQGEGVYNNVQPKSNQMTQDPKDAKIAEYFGEELNREEDNEESKHEDGDESQKPATGRNVGDNKYNGTLGRTNSTIGIIHEEPEVEETVDPAGGENQADKTSKRSKKKGGIVTSTKVMIRHLPRNLRKQEFLDVLGPIPDHTFLYFCSGYFLSQVSGKRSTGYCSINFSDQEDADMFVNMYRFFVLRDEKGNDHFISTDFAISQRIPKVSNAAVTRQTDIYDLEKDPRYQEFRKKYEASPGVIGKEVNPDGTVTADVILKEIEEKDTRKDNSQLTPLLEFLIKQANASKESRRLKRENEKVKAAARKEKKRDQRREKNKPKAKESHAKDDGSGGHAVEVELIRRDKLESGPSGDSNAKSGRQDATRNSQAKKTGEKATTSEAKDSKRDRGTGEAANRNRRGERKATDRKQAGPKVKLDAAPAEVEPKTVNKPVRLERKEKETTTEASGTGTANADDNMLGKKKVVKKIVKVKRVVKSKSSDTVASDEPRTSVKPAEAKKPSLVIPKEPISSARASTEKSSTTVASDNEKNTEGKRKRSRPDIQIYRPGSLRSGQGPGPSRSSGQEKSNSSRSNQESSKKPVKEAVKEKSNEP